MKDAYFDFSWYEVAKRAVATPDSTSHAGMVNRYPGQFIFGAHQVAPATQEKYLKVYNQYGPLWKLLTREAGDKVRTENYARIFGRLAAECGAPEAADVR